MSTYGRRSLIAHSEYEVLLDDTFWQISIIDSRFMTQVAFGAGDHVMDHTKVE